LPTNAKTVVQAVTIRTKFVRPPIPIRNFDWCSWHPEYEERNWLAWAGWAATEAEAIADLERIDRERAEAEQDLPAL
jgi:hypothetical protein